MTSRRHRPSFLWVALLAIAGMLSVAVPTPARACAEIKAPKACCEAWPAVDCHCCDPSLAPASLSGGERLEGNEWSGSPVVIRLDAPLAGRACECRSNAPSVPAPRPDSRNSDDGRSDPVQEQVVAYLAHASRPSPLAFRLNAANLSPPKSLLYLRTLHLLV